MRDGIFIDEHTETLLSQVHPHVADSWRLGFFDFYRLTGRVLKVTEGIRDDAEQQRLYEIGREKREDGFWYIVNPSIVKTYAKPNRSFHKYGLALDSCFNYTNDPYLEHSSKAYFEDTWQAYGQCFKRHGFKWGGDWGAKKDRPHVYMPFNLSLDTLEKLMMNHGLSAVWEQCNNAHEIGEI